MGGALADLAFGAACPSGKLAETLPIKLDGAEHLHFASHPRQVRAAASPNPSPNANPHPNANQSPHPTPHPTPNPSPNTRQVVYREGLNVGYRQYRDEHLRASGGGTGGAAPSHWLFPFGHGLTYAGMATTTSE